MAGGKHILGKNKQQRVFGTAKVGDRGQIVIPQEARRYFGISPGDTLLILGNDSSGLVIAKPDINVSTKFVYIVANAVSIPTTPIILPDKPLLFSSAECGAWSVAIISIVPSSKPSTSASLSSSLRIGGFIFHLPCSSSSISQKAR